MANEQNLTKETTEVKKETEVSEDVAGEEEGEETAENGSKVLVAVYPILFHSHQYKVGDILPVNYPDMVKAWIEAGTATWKATEAVSIKAKAVTAEPGLAGMATVSESEDGEDLVGRVPKTAKRSKK